MADHDDRPVLSGLVALVAVAVVVGLLTGLGALFATQMLGLAGGGGDGAAGDPEAGDSLYMPDPSPTEPESGPLVTLLPTDDDTAASEETSEPENSSDRKKKRKNRKEERDKPRIALSAGQQSVSPMERIDLTGVYPGGEGAILQVQRFENGEWVDFYSVNANVSNETFTTYIETSRTGVQRFRMFDRSNGRASNEVRITVG